MGMNNLESKEIESGLQAPIVYPLEDGQVGGVVSTGSTLLDLAIFGGRIRGGGIPGGIIVEIYGPSGAGKTSILSEVVASIQLRGGDTKILDPEARMDKEYAKIYGVDINKDNYYRPDTVVEVFEEIRHGWGKEKKKDSTEIIHGIGVDSLAALSTELEMGQGDKMGMKRAKDFSQELRKTCRVVKKQNWLVVCTNQVRQGDSGEYTTGGKGIPFYSSLRIKVAPAFQGRAVEKQITIGKKIIKKVKGIKSICYVKKSSIDDPYREAPIYIMFGHGIDDVRGNLIYVKEMTEATKFDCFGAEWAHVDRAIEVIEANNLEHELRERVIDLWIDVEKKFTVARKPKVRF